MKRRTFITLIGGTARHPVRSARAATREDEAYRWFMDPNASLNVASYHLFTCVFDEVSRLGFVEGKPRRRRYSALGQFDVPATCP